MNINSNGIFIYFDEDSINRNGIYPISISIKKKLALAKQIINQNLIS
jgi:hypothetical protein